MSIISESLSDHFKKHGKKYLVGLTAAALASGAGVAAYKNKDKIKSKFEKSKMSLGKKIAIGTGIGVGALAAHQGYHVAKAVHIEKKRKKMNKTFDKAKEKLNEFINNQENNLRNSKVEDGISFASGLDAMRKSTAARHGLYGLIRNRSKMNDQFDSQILKHAKQLIPVRLMNAHKN